MARAAFVSFEGGAGLEVVLSELGNALVSENFAIHQGDPVQAIADALAQTPTLIVWDNFETVLPNGDISLPTDALQQLLDAGARWGRAGGGSRLLITTRDDALPHPAFAAGRRCRHIELEGLALPDALEMAGEVIDALGLPRPPREGLERLLGFLGGHPLSIQLVLPALRETPSVETIIAEFDALLPGFTQGTGKQRNESLEVSLRFSIRRLSAEAQALLPKLAMFQGGAWEPTLLEITEIDEAMWATMKPELARAALIRLEDLPGVKSPYIHLHPTLAPYLQHQPDAQSLIPDLQSRYWQGCYELARFLYLSDDQNPVQARAIAVREMPNLRCALRLALSVGTLDKVMEAATSLNRFLFVFGRWRERDEVALSVRQRYEEARTTNQNELSKAECLFESEWGEQLRLQGKAREAERAFRALLGRLEIATYDEADFDRVRTLVDLGRCLYEQGQPTAAAEQLQTALRAAKSLEQMRSVQQLMLSYHTYLADTLTRLCRFVEAEREYESALKINEVLGDIRNEAAIHGQLGALARKQNKTVDARAHQTKCLQIFHKLGENYGEAIAWHELGLVAEDDGDSQEAERCYKEQLGNVTGMAMNFNQLAIVAEHIGRLDEALKWHFKSNDVFNKVADKFSMSLSNNNLASLLLTLGRLNEAEAYAHRAREIKETLDLSAEPWKTYDILAAIAQARGNRDDARAWRRKAHEAYAEFPGSDAEIEKFKPLILMVIVAAQGDMSTRNEVLTVLSQGRAIGGKDAQLAEAFLLILAGERDLNVLTGDMSYDSAFIIRRVLEELAAPNSLAGFTLPHLLDSVERAARGDAQLAAQLHPAMDAMTKTAPNPTLRALGSALRGILEGDRAPDLDDLPPELASAVRGLLARLRQE